MSEQWKKYQLNTQTAPAQEAVRQGKKTEEEIGPACLDWVRDQSQRCNNIDFDFTVFLKQMASKVLLDETMSRNRLFSPFSLFCGLFMLSMLTEGTTQAEINRLLGCADYKQLLLPVRTLLQGNRIDDGEVIRPSSSFWLDQRVQVEARIPDMMAMHFGAPSFSGDMKAEDYRQAAAAWLNDVTGGQLQDRLEKLEIKKDTVMLILTSMLLNAKWENKFNKRSTRKGVFHAAGEDYECPFMHAKLWSNIWFGDGFRGLQWKFEGIGCVWFLLPDEGKTPDDILRGGSLWQLPDWRCQEKRDVTLAIPKFDLTVQNDMKNSLKALGVNRVFSDESETPYTKVNNNSIKLADVKHDVRLKIDEDGCSAAAYTILRGIVCAGIPQIPPKMDFILDRPFIVTVYGMGDLPLFAGVVNRP